MKAVTCQNSKLELVDLPDPQPGPGQVVINVLGCGICGSDLHVRYHADAEADVLAEIGYDGFMRSGQQVVLGHEFVGEVVGYGPGTRKKIATGTPVVAVPLTRRADELHAIGLSAAAPGGYAEQVVVEESLMFALPDGLSPKLAVLTEPLAVGWHAVRRADVKKSGVVIVIGCGPVGLAVICMLKAWGVGTVVASDFSPGRRQLAAACGADIVVDPGSESPYESPGDRFPDEPPGRHRARNGNDGETQAHAGAVAARLARRGETGREAETPGDLRVRWPSRHPGRHHRKRAAALARGGGRGLRGTGHHQAGDGDQQGDRPAVCRGLHATGVQRHPAHARPGQGEGGTDRDWNRRAARRRGRLRCAGRPGKARENHHRTGEFSH